MKKFIAIALVSVVFASCSKNYDCNCTDSSSGEENQLTFRTNSKSHATRLCDDWSQRQKAAVPDKKDVVCTIK